MGGRGPSEVNKVISEFDVLRSQASKDSDPDERAAKIAELNIRQAMVVSLVRIAELVTPPLLTAAAE